MPAQAAAGGVANPQFLDRGAIVQPALLEIVERLGVAIELVLIESGGLLQHGGSVGVRSTELFEVSEAFAKRQMVGQLNKAQKIAALTTAVTVEEIFAGVDIERGSGFRVQQTESHELGAVTGRPTGPILLLQIVEQRQAQFEFFDILAHGRCWPPGANVRRSRPAFPGKDGGHRENFSATQRPENLQNWSHPRQRPSFMVVRIPTR